MQQCPSGSLPMGVGNRVSEALCIIRNSTPFARAPLARQCNTHSACKSSMPLHQTWHRGSSY
ncbi:MAG: hypothetical protein ACK56F_17210, partial [bacterium]